MKTLDKNLITSILAVVVSAGAMGIASIKFSTADSTQLNVRMEGFEKTVYPLVNGQKTLDLSVAVMRREIGRNSEDIKNIIRVVSEVEKSSAVTSAVLVNLTIAVKELSNNTKMLNKTMTEKMNSTSTAVAVLQSEVSGLSEALSKKN